MTLPPTYPPTYPATTSAKPDRAFVPGVLGRLLSRGYAGVVEYRNRRFDAGRGVVTLDRPVISVGNLSMGGTGKTPMVERIVTLLREHGRDPAIAMRGYRSKRSGISDEAEQYKARFADLPLVAQ
ncbi:Tetraacyldisaccharide 4'-kinase, partial [hydrothermal vent metagenome]